MSHAQRSSDAAAPITRGQEGPEGLTATSSPRSNGDADGEPTADWRTHFSITANTDASPGWAQSETQGQL